MAKISDNLYSALITMLPIKFGWNYPFESFNIGNFAKCIEWLQTELKRLDTKSTLHMQYIHVEPQVEPPNFHPFPSTVSRSEDFMIFKLTPC